MTRKNELRVLAIAAAVAAKMKEHDETTCPVCSGFKFSFEKYCRDCEQHREIVEKMRRQKERNRHFGDIW